jgi:hypothetical protein
MRFNLAVSGVTLRAVKSLTTNLAIDRTLTVAHTSGNTWNTRVRDRMLFTRLVQDCERRLRTLHLPPSASMTALCAHIGGLRGRPIQLVPVDLGGAQPSGLWVAVAEVDVIAYELATSRLHQKHIIAHELAHIICDHRTVEPLDDDTARMLFPDLDPQLVRNSLRRNSYADVQEMEAEITASIILASVARSAAHDPADPMAGMYRVLGLRPLVH